MSKEYILFSAAVRCRDRVMFITLLHDFTLSSVAVSCSDKVMYITHKVIWTLGICLKECVTIMYTPGTLNVRSF